MNNTSVTVSFGKILPKSTSEKAIKSYSIVLQKFVFHLHNFAPIRTPKVLEKYSGQICLPQRNEVLLEYTIKQVPGRNQKTTPFAPGHLFKGDL